MTDQISQYRLLEQHHKALKAYLATYLGESNTSKGKVILRNGYEVGSDSKKSMEKYLALSQYEQDLSRVIEKTSKKLFQMQPY